jgi:hypothetical protein
VELSGSAGPAKAGGQAFYDFGFGVEGSLTAAAQALV